MQDALQGKEDVWLEPPAGARIRKIRKLPPTYFQQKKNKNKPGGGLFVLQVQNTGYFYKKKCLWTTSHMRDTADKSSLKRRN